MVQIEAFTRAMLSMDDKTFFSIMRNYLGSIATPFHKPTLIKRLITVLSNPEIQKTIRNFADPLDRRLLTLVSLFKSPTIEDLYKLLQDDLPYYQLRFRIFNLEERLLLLSDSQGTNLSINPFFKECIEQLIDFRLLAPSSIKTEQEPETACIYIGNPLFLATALNSAVHDPEIPKRRNKAASLFRESDREHLITAWNFAHTLYRRKISSAAADGLSLVTESANLSARAVLETGISVQVGLLESSAVIGILLELLSLFQGHIVIKREFHQLFSTACLFLQKDCRSEAVRKRDEIFRALEELKIIFTVTEGYGISSKAFLALKEEGFRERSGSIQSFDSDFTVHIDADAANPDIYRLIFFLEITSIDLLYTFTLTKLSFLKALDAGASAEKLFTLLDRLHIDLSPHIRSSLLTWEKSYERVECISGILLKTDEQLARVIEAHEEFKSHIITAVSAGVYLMNQGTEKVWRDLLSSFGIDFLPRTQSETSDSLQEISDQQNVKLLPPPYHQTGVRLPDHGYAAIGEENRTGFEFREYLLGRVRGKEAGKGFTEAEREELSARIEKKLILSESQLTHGAIRSTITEARGLDYQGKLNLCRSALSSQNSLLEIHTRDRSGAEIVDLVDPREIIKVDRQNSELQGILLPEEEPYTIAVRKISLLRKLKGNLFSP